MQAVMHQALYFYKLLRTFEIIASFKYLGSVITNEDSKLQDSIDNSSIDKVETSLD